jgi:hypothetical protein
MDLGRLPDCFIRIYDCEKLPTRNTPRFFSSKKKKLLFIFQEIDFDNCQISAKLCLDLLN